MMQPRFICESDFQADIEKIVNLQGHNYIDEHMTCQYVRGDAPSCLIGHYLINKLGIPQTYFDERSTDSWNQKNVDTIDDLFDEISERFNISFELGIREEMKELQVMQDDGWSWGACVDAVFHDIDPDPR